MQVTALEVERFRGIDRLRLELTQMTVLLGENRVGKTTLVDALDYCLGHRPADRSPFVLSDLQGDPASHGDRPIRLTVEFTPRRPSQWDEAPFACLQGLTTTDAQGQRLLRLRLSGTPGVDGVAASWAFLDLDGAPLVATPTAAQVEAVRDLCPCLLLGANRYQLAGAKPELPPDKLNDDPQRVVSRVFRQVSLTRGGLSAAEVQAGLEAARQLKDLTFEEQVEAIPRGLEEMLRTPRSLAPPPLRDDETSSSAQNLGLLILVGSLIEAANGEALQPGARPLVVIEEPEAHLHPVLAASLWGTLERLPAQQVITTYSGDLLASAPLESLRRLTRPANETVVHQLERRSLSLDDQRRVAYHVRIQRGASLFARCWLLVEGETEAWLLPELARRCGYVLASEGVFCLEFAQCGVAPLIKLANALGIEWHLLADGDQAGQAYQRMAKRGRRERPMSERITGLRERDVEHCLYAHGYDEVFQEAAFPGGKRRQRGGRRRTRKQRRRERRRGHQDASHIIEKAIRRESKPLLALRVLEATAEPDSPGVPEQLQRAIEVAVWLARTSVGIPTPRPPTIRLDRKHLEAELDRDESVRGG